MHEVFEFYPRDFYCVGLSSYLTESTIKLNFLPIRRVIPRIETRTSYLHKYSSGPMPKKTSGPNNIKRMWVQFRDFQF